MHKIGEHNTRNVSSFYQCTLRCCSSNIILKFVSHDCYVQKKSRVGVDYKSPITITITVPIKLSITITITVVIEKLGLRLQSSDYDYDYRLVYHGNDSRLFIRHVHLPYYHA